MTTEAVAAEGIPDKVPVEVPIEPARRGTRRLARIWADLVTLARPVQWTKNVLVIPLAAASGASWDAGALLRTGWAVIVFCLASSMVYVINDIADRDLDRAHPAKRMRPIASGRISASGARIYAGALALLLCMAAFAGPTMHLWPLAAYVALNLAYSRWLKHVPLVDICVVSAGFGLRVLQGYAATGGDFSGWFLVAVLTGCMVLIAGKRRHELTTAGTAHRPALRGYNVALLDQVLAVSAILAVLSFLLYLRHDAPIGDLHNLLPALAAPLALFGVFRYLQSVLVRRRGADPVRTLMRDRLLIADALLLGAAVLTALIVESSS
ncbi:decaprenyl-phosphate phosphoribosyltransferase [Phytohabitans flavus]|uniref:Decaprenyl-phosphate phosphoribosyltransferase n=1 Tax=Phytohabitans flavus TaxID=1076124 RepID=A0A6F8XNI1_9ACTN|nr:UbiA prenyltransferase family protein [Phytohabitans flavus]BCB75385.1 decaprenyl-phosphate phosphoribosyltransferase [Phytohabitans flavus]